MPKTRAPEPPVTKRRSQDVINAALQDEDLMRQVQESLEAERRGDPGVSFSYDSKEERFRRSE
jgi:hypothetical protein